MMHALANPARFLRIARPVTTWLLLIGLVLAVGGMAAGLILTPPDYLQGETVRILYIHVPAAWLGMAGWLGIPHRSMASALCSNNCLNMGSLWASEASMALALSSQSSPVTDEFMVVHRTDYVSPT